MRAHWSFLALVLAASAARAGTEDTRELLQAREVKEYVALALNDSDKPSFQYTFDKSGEPATEKSLGEELVVTSRGQINIVLRYLNPIRYSWSTSQKVEDDPAYLATSRLAATASALFALLSAAQPYSVMIPGDRTGVDASGSAPDQPAQLYAPELLEWSMWVAAQKDASCVRGVDAVQESEKDFYPGEKSERRPALQWREDIEAALRDLVNAADLEALRKASDEAKQKIDSLGKLNEEAAGRLRKVKTEAIDRVDPKACGNFARYSRGVLERYRAAMTEVLAARKALLVDLRALREHVDAVTELGGGADGAEYFKLANVTNESGKLKRITVTIKRRAIHLPDESENGGRLIVVEKAPVTVSIKVREHQWLVVEFAPGFVYTGLSSRRYGTATANGATTVTATASEPAGVAVVGMLNLIPRPLGAGPVWPIAQVGVGTGKPVPMVLGGLGIRLSMVDLSLTVGAGFTWVQNPGTLQPGDVVAGPDELQRNLRYDLTLVPYYLGLQKGF